MPVLDVGRPEQRLERTHLVVAVVGEAVAIDGEPREPHRGDAADEIFHRQRRRRALPLAVATAHAPALHRSVFECR